VEAWLDDVPLGRARLGLPRPDVAAASPSRFAPVSGFELRVGREAGVPLPSGEASLRVTATSLAGEVTELARIPVLVEDATPPRPLAAPPAAPGPAPPRGRGLRTLVFTNVLTYGGASYLVYDLVREAHRQGRIDPFVVTAVDGPLRSGLEADGIPVHVSSPSSLGELDAYLGRVAEMTAWARPGEFQLAYINTTSGYSAPWAAVAGQLGIPAAWAIHESFELVELWGGMAGGARADAEANLSRARLAIFEAEATQRMYRDILEDGRSQTIPYGVDFGPIEAARAAFDRDAARAEAGIPAGAELLLCLGTVEPRKAQIPLALAFERVAAGRPECHLAIVGGNDGESSRALAAHVAGSAVRERIHLVDATGEVQRWHGMSDLLVCASDVESLPRVVIEAMAWQTPVLATAIFGLPELIADGETGWLCEPRDVEALAAGIERVLGLPAEERRRVGEAGRALVLERHDLGAYAGRVSDLLDEVVGEG
jgi:glycosyltransferase involved in cell wall biosynthesis